MNKKRRIKKARLNLAKTEKKLQKARAERIWIEENHDIHILNYPYRKF